MKKTTVLKMVAQNFGLSAKDVMEDWLQDGWLKLEDVQAILPKTISNTPKVRNKKSMHGKLKVADGSELADCNVIDSQIVCIKAESGKVKVGMFYYAKDKTFSEKLIPNKKVSGVVAYVDGSGLHGLVWLLNCHVFIWSEDDLFVGMPKELSGKENTRLILQASQNQNAFAYAAKFCAEYDFDGVQIGEAFLPSIDELKLVRENRQLIDEKLALIKGANLLPKGGCWSSSEVFNNAAMALHFPSGEVRFEFKSQHLCYTYPCVAF